MRETEQIKNYVFHKGGFRQGIWSIFNRGEASKVSVHKRNYMINMVLRGTCCVQNGAVCGYSETAVLL